MNLAIINGDALAELRKIEPESVQCCVTSPPYWGLRDYGVAGQLGLESTPAEYVAKMVEVFREVRRVLRGNGTLWCNLGDSYNGSGKARGGGGNGPSSSKQVTNRGAYFENEGPRCVTDLKPKDLIGIPWLIAFALRNDGWWLRSDIIWHKPNPMPESVTDRPTKAHEYLFLMSKSERYYYDAEAIREPVADTSLERMKYGLNAVVNPDPHDMRHGNGWKRFRNGETMEDVGFVDPAGRNKRSVWTVSTAPYADAHFATFPPDLIKPCILAGTKPGDIVLDPFFGSGTTGMVALELGRKAIGIELNPEYCKLAEQRCHVTPGLALK